MSDRELMKGLALAGDPGYFYAKRFLENAGFDLNTSGLEAKEWCLREAKGGNTEAQFVCAELLSTGLFGAVDKKAALDWCAKAAAARFAPAVLLLSQFHEAGWAGLTPNARVACELMEQAAQLGYAPAMNAIAHTYLAQKDSSGTRDLAIKYFRQAADLDDPNAQSVLASLLLQSGRAESIREGLALLHRAAEQDLAHAHRMLGYFYKGGQYGLPLDEQQANFHFKKADELELAGE